MMIEVAKKDHGIYLADALASVTPLQSSTISMICWLIEGDINDHLINKYNGLSDTPENRILIEAHGINVVTSGLRLLADRIEERSLRLKNLEIR